METWRAKRNCAATFVLAVAAAVAMGQPAPGKPAFEEASVRMSTPLDMTTLAVQMQAGKLPRFGAHVDGARAEYTYMSLKDLIANAYSVKAYQVTGPAWMASERFDIVAKMPEGAPKEDVPAMLQTLLEERFGLAAHRDRQEHPVVALVVGKDGPRLKDAAVSVDPIAEDVPLKPGEFKIDGPDGPIRVTRNGDGTTTMNMGAKGTIVQKIDVRTQTMHMESSTVTMAGFADMLTNLMQIGGAGSQQVVDMTGLKGNYQVALDFSMTDLIAMVRGRAKELGMTMPGGPAGSDEADNRQASKASDPAGRSSIYASVEKLGLKLEMRNAPVEQVVVDKVEKTPTED
jgi:uncharacterized protein (TIGR03435 family)